MVIAKIHAGLGNQMFQYATAKNLSLQRRTSLLLDTLSYETDTFRKYELGKFNISARHLNAVWGKLDWPLTEGRRNLPVRLFLHAIRSPLVTKKVLVDAEQGFDERLASTTGHLYLEGYWQSELYFTGIRDVLLREFTFKDAPDPENARCLSDIGSQNAVCVHIRRGDYVTTAFGQTKHGICSLDYYRDAVAHIQKRTTNPSFFIFSDDPDWVAANFPRLNRMTIVSHNVGKKDSEDLRLMMNCRHFIIANSSFSWWAA